MIIEWEVLTLVQQDLLKYIMTNTMVTRKQLSAATLYPRTTAYDNLFKLEKMGYIERLVPLDMSRSRGRPRVYWIMKNGEDIDEN